MPKSRASPGAAVQRARPATAGISRPRLRPRSSSRSPLQFRVYQRDVNDKADIPIVLDDFDEGWHGGERQP